MFFMIKSSCINIILGDSENAHLKYNQITISCYKLIVTISVLLSVVPLENELGISYFM